MKKLLPIAIVSLLIVIVAGALYLLSINSTHVMSNGQRMGNTPGGHMMQNGQMMNDNSMPGMKMGK